MSCPALLPSLPAGATTASSRSTSAGSARASASTCAGASASASSCPSDSAVSRVSNERPATDAPCTPRSPHS
eukprot:224378-Chlamydomonas_euryale.AAC.1